MKFFDDIAYIHSMYKAEFANDADCVELHDLIYEIVSLGMGRVYDSVEAKSFVSYFPKLSLQSAKRKVQGKTSANEFYNTYLHYITLNIGEYGLLDDKHKELYRQLQYPMPVGRHVSIDDFRTFLQDLSDFRFMGVNVCGSPSSSPFHKELMTFISDVTVEKVLYIRYESYLKEAELVLSVFDRIVVWIDSVEDAGDILKRNMQRNYTSVAVHPMSISEYEAYMGLLGGVFDIVAYPYYNGNNIDFFKNYVFLDHGDILSQKIEKRQVFSRQVLNTNFFGKLTVTFDGRVFAGLDYKFQVGTIHNKVEQLIANAMDDKGSPWFKVRDSLPCTECVFRWLCPSPSVYESALGYNCICKRL